MKIRKLKIDRFILAIIASVVVAYFFPHWGRENSVIPLNTITNIGISFIFFFYGLKLNPEKIKTGLKNWKLHLLIQSSTFIFFPILIIAFYPLIGSEYKLLIWTSFLFLAALPSTVSSSVVMVSIAKGNIPAAIFNASISGLIGIIITPFWMSLFLNNINSNFDLHSIYLKLSLEIFIPILLGLSLQRLLGKYVEKFKNQLTVFDKTVILLIIYKSFAESFEKQIFSSVKLTDFLWITTGIILLFFFVYYMVGFVAKKLKFTKEDQITAQFCGTKKSLVHGTVFSKVLLPASYPIGLMLLPLMIFHAIQIFFVGIIANKISRDK